MSRENRERLIRREMLRILDECGSYMLPASTLLTSLNMVISPPVATDEFNRALNWMEAEHCAVSVRPELGGDLRWKITDIGRAILAG